MSGGLGIDVRAALAFLSAAVTLPALAIGQDLPADQRCANGADVRRIEIRFVDADGNLPCKVIYRPETDSDTLGIVSWQDIDSVEACRAQAKEVTDRLTVEGWTCAADQAEVPEPDGGLAAQFAADVAEERAKLVDAESQIATDVVEQPTQDEIATLVGDGDTSSIDDADVPAAFIDNPDLPAPPDVLVSLIEEDLAQLDTTLDGVLEAQIAGYGDLNADEVDDALVLYTYTSPQPAYRQVLMAYVFDGESYQLTATKPVGGTSSATKAAKVELIEKGVIHLTLQAFEPGDLACCPSGARRLALALRDLDLVEIDAGVPTR
ncbi:MAG: hypothetical protein AAF543_01955 [Pseudomonadota bacterium]